MCLRACRLFTPRRKARGRDKHGADATTAQKRADLIGFFSFSEDGLITAVREDIGVITAKYQERGYDRHLEASHPANC